MRVKTADISGFKRPDGSPTAYELCCQKMLFDGIEWLKGKQPAIFYGTRTYKNIYGILEAPEALKPLEQMWEERYQPSGAQHQAVMQHLMRITQHGFDAWLVDAGRDRIIEVELDISRDELSNIYKEDIRIISSDTGDK